MNWLADIPLGTAYSRASARSAIGRRSANTRSCRTSWSSTVKLKTVNPCTNASGIQTSGFENLTSAQVVTPRIRNWRAATRKWRAGVF